MKLRHLIKGLVKIIVPCLVLSLYLPTDSTTEYIYTYPPIGTAGAHAAIHTAIVLPEVAEAKLDPEPKYKSLGTFRITAYCSCSKCCGSYATNRPTDEAGNPIVYGASGAVLIPEYSVAVDPAVIPYGTKLYINGKEYIAHDSGYGVDGNSIDLYFTSHQRALQWGVKYIEIFILEEV